MVVQVHQEASLWLLDIVDDEEMNPIGRLRYADK